MITLHLWLPSKHHYSFRKFISKHGKTPLEHKFWEIELMYSHWTHVFRFEFIPTRKTDHAGLWFQIGLFGFEFSFSFHDNRHWDDVNNKWEEYEDEN